MMLWCVLGKLEVYKLELLINDPTELLMTKLPLALQP